MPTTSPNNKSQAVQTAQPESATQGTNALEHGAISDTILKSQLADLMRKLAGPNVGRKRWGDDYNIAWDHKERKFFIELTEGEVRTAYYTLTPKAKMLRLNGADISKAPFPRADYLRIIEVIEKDLKKWETCGTK